MIAADIFVPSAGSPVSGLVLLTLVTLFMLLQEVRDRYPKFDLAVFGRGPRAVLTAEAQDTAYWRLMHGLWVSSMMFGVNMAYATSHWA